MLLQQIQRSWFGHQSRFEVPAAAAWLNGHLVSVVMGLRFRGWVDGVTRDLKRTPRT